MRQNVLTIITEIDPDKRAVLEQILEVIRNDLFDNPYIAFSSLSLLHFASFVIGDDQVTPALLIFENNFDGELSDYLDELITVSGNGLHQIYQCCIAYAVDTFQPQNLKTFLANRIVPPNAYHIGNVGRTVKDVRANQQLREKLQSFLDQLFLAKKPTEFSSVQLRENMQEFVKTQVDPALSYKLPPHQTLAERVGPWINLILFGLLAIVIVLALLPVTIIVLLVLRHKENTDQVDTPQPSVSQIDTLMKTENMITQNHLASITQIKPGKFRLVTLKTTLFAVNLLARISNKGKLSDIPTIHFAHWSIINQGKQLLFLSNFDSSWTSYLDDFIDKASRGLTGVWSNTQGFPKTRFLILDGATDEAGFKAYARNHQVPSLVWYSAYSDLTVQNIDKDSLIREGVFTPFSDTETKEWLKHF
jgi:hypothetical protein